MQKNWTWGHPETDTDTPAARHGSGDLPEEERTRAADADLPEQDEDMRVVGAPSERDEVLVPSAPPEEPGHDDALTPVPPGSEHHDTVTPAPSDNEHHDTVTPEDHDTVVPAATEDQPGLDDAVVSPTPVDEPEEVLDETPDDVVTEQRPTPEGHEGDRIEQLVEPAQAGAFKDRWREVQSDFVDDPYDAVRRADELASEVLSSLTDALNGHKQQLDDRWRTDEADRSDTERLRQALRRYRDFCDRMLGA